MARRLSMTTRRELKQAVGERYRAAGRWERRQILDEFARVTGYHRKHALRVLHRPFVPELEGLPFVEFSWEGLERRRQYVWAGMGKPSIRRESQRAPIHPPKRRFGLSCETQQSG